LNKLLLLSEFSLKKAALRTPSMVLRP